MKVLRFDLADAHKEDATKFYYQIIHAAMATGFPIPESIMGFDYRIKVRREDLLDELTEAFCEAAGRYGWEYDFRICGTVCTLTEEKASPPKGGEAEEELTG